MSKEIGYAVIFGIILHQLPVSLGLAGILRQSNISIKYQYILMILFGFAGFIGYIISLGFLAHMNE
jgi:zinc transporter ZupT